MNEIVVRVCAERVRFGLSVLHVRSYYMMMLWFPELMNRLRWYETAYPGDRDKTTMCEVLSVYNVEPDALANVKCDDDIDGSVYLNIMIVGVACIPLCIVVPLYVNKLGLRFFLGNCCNVLVSRPVHCRVTSFSNNRYDGAVDNLIKTPNRLGTFALLVVVNSTYIQSITFLKQVPDFYSTKNVNSQTLTRP